MGKRRQTSMNEIHEEARSRIEKPGTLPSDFILPTISNKSILHVSDKIEI